MRKTLKRETGLACSTHVGNDSATQITQISRCSRIHESTSFEDYWLEDVRARQVICVQCSVQFCRMCRSPSHPTVVLYLVTVRWIAESTCFVNLDIIPIALNKKRLEWCLRCCQTDCVNRIIDTICEVSIVFQANCIYVWDNNECYICVSISIYCVKLQPAELKKSFNSLQFYVIYSFY